VVLADGLVVLNTSDPLVAQLDRALAEDSVTVAERSTIKVVDTVAGVLSCLGTITGGTAIYQPR
jgi:hypothetical protein